MQGFLCAFRHCAVPGRTNCQARRESAALAQVRGQQRAGKKVDGRLCPVVTCQWGCTDCYRKAGGIDVGAVLERFFGSAPEFIGSRASFANAVWRGDCLLGNRLWAVVLSVVRVPVRDCVSFRYHDGGEVHAIYTRQGVRRRRRSGKSNISRCLQAVRDKADVCV